MHLSFNFHSWIRPREIFHNSLQRILNQMAWGHNLVNTQKLEVRQLRQSSRGRGVFIPALRVLRVDTSAPSFHLRVAPSRISPDSMVQSRNPPFGKHAPVTARRGVESSPWAGEEHSHPRFTRRLLTPACSRFQDKGRRLSSRSYLSRICKIARRRY